MKIGIIAAMKHEMEILLDSMNEVIDETILGFKIYRGYLGGNDVTISECGIGKVNAAIATSILIREFECELIINTGIAGGISPLKKRDVIIADRIYEHDFDATIFGYKLGQVPGLPEYYSPDINTIVYVKSIFNKLNIEYKSATIYSGDKFVTSTDVLKGFGDVSGCATDMESAAVAQTATKAGVSFVTIRFISDSIGEENQEEDYFKFENEMSETSAKICGKIISNI